MDKKNSISAGQLACLCFAAHSSAVLTGTQLQGAGNPQGLLLAAPFSLILSVLSLLPVLLLRTRHESMSVLDCARFRFSNAGGAVFCALYGLYFLYTPSLAVARYNIYVSSTLLPQAQLFLLAFAVAATACYGAFLGLEALARASGFILVAIAAALIFLFCALIPRLDLLNYTPPDSSAWNDAAYNGLSVFSGTAELALPVVLLPFAKGKPCGKFMFWLIGEAVLVALIGFFVTGVLGPYAATQPFPFYVASTFAEAGSLQRLDALYAAIWTAGLFVRVTVFLIAFSLCISGLFGKKAEKRSLFLGAAIIFAVGTVLSGFPQLLASLSGAVSTATATVFFTVLPLMILTADRFCGRSAKKEAAS